MTHYAASRRRGNRSIPLLLLLSAAASACSRNPSRATINTDDGAIDGNWPSAPIVTDPAGDADLPGDILRAWMVIDPDLPGRFYFRVETAAAGDARVLVELDCDQDGSFTGSHDVYVVYDSFDDEIEVGQGTRDLAYMASPSAFGERVGENFEWMADVRAAAENDVEWGYCLGDVDARFHAFSNKPTSDVTQTATFSPSGWAGPHDQE